MLASGPAFAAQAEALFDEGNRLFREELYWLSLERYREAAAAGMDTPLLDYNMGVAYFRAGQYQRARAFLEKAAESSKLRPLAHYNLGLNAYAEDATEEALQWFRLARDQRDNLKIAALARRALDRLQVSRPRVGTEKGRMPGEDRSPFGKLSLYAFTGIGSDDNVFRTPDRPYVDFSQPNQPAISPAVRSGTYVPVSLAAKYEFATFEHESFYGEYRMAGRFYLDKALTDGDKYLHEASVGSQYQRRNDNRETALYGAFRVAQSRETYYDPDDGTPRDVGGVDIRDRLNYVRYGPDLSFRRGIGRFSLNGTLKAYLYDYDKVDVVPGYDHEYYLVGLQPQLRLPSSLLRLKAHYFARRYEERPSFDLDGRQTPGNAPVDYRYLQLGLVVRQRIGSSTWFGVGYDRTDRTDRYLGYNDYVRDSYEFEWHWTPHERLNIELYAHYRNYDYAHAFAFNNSSQEARTLETRYVGGAAKYRVWRGLSVVVDARIRENTSNDTRINYARNLLSLGVAWQN